MKCGTSLRLTSILALLFFSMNVGELAAQCGTPPPVEPDTSGLRGGLYLPTWNPSNPSQPVTVNCVVIFVDFPDDNTDPDNKVWPATFNPSLHPWQTTAGWSATNRPPHPDLMNDIIDISVTSPPPTGKKWNVTTYFRDMSYGKFNLVGHVLYQQAGLPFSDTTFRPDGMTYSTSLPFKTKTRRYVIKHVIDSVNARIARGEISNVFEGMDAWNMVNGRNFISGNDQAIDLVMVCFRNDRLNHPDWDWTGIANLDQAAGLKVNDGTSDSAYVVGTQGLTVQNMKNYPLSTQTIWHEVGHLLRCSEGTNDRRDHQYWDGMWSVMTHRAEGYPTMNSWERWRMGWLDFYDYDPASSMDGNGDTVTICDLATHPQAIRIKLPDTATKEYFFIEHHRQSGSDYITNLPDSTLPWYDPNDVMSYDLVEDPVRAPGLYMIYKDGRGDLQAPGTFQIDEGDLRVLAADGRWNWVTDGWVPAPWNPAQQLRLYRRGSAARSPLGLGNNPDSGLYVDWNTYKTDRQFMSRNYPVPNTNPFFLRDSVETYDYMFSWRMNSGDADGIGDTANPGYSRRRGDGGDAWRPEWNNVLSPWSNPNTNTRNNTPTGIMVELVGQTDTTSTVLLRFSGALSGPPSKPQNLLASLWYDVGDSLYRPVLTWETNLEPDVDSTGFYIISRCDGNCDLEINWHEQDTVAGNAATWTDTVEIDGAGYLDFHHEYRIRAVDVQDFLSVWSERYAIHSEGDIVKDPDPPPTKAVAGERAVEMYGTALRLEAHPNPVLSRTELVWRLPSAGGVSIRIFDGAGRQVAWPVNRYGDEGEGRAEVDLSGLAPGRYHALLQYRGVARITEIHLLP